MPQLLQNTSTLSRMGLITNKSAISTIISSSIATPKFKCTGPTNFFATTTTSYKRNYILSSYHCQSPALYSSSSSSYIASTKHNFQTMKKKPNLLIRNIHTEGEYHQKADRTLNQIQDILEYYLEDTQPTLNFEINFASGVLNIHLSSQYGTWVLNKQTPNKQIWWSSPISGPRRYEWDEELEKWVWTKYIDYRDASSSGKSAGAGAGAGGDGGGSWEESVSLGEALKKEMVELFQLEDGLEELDEL